MYLKSENDAVDPSVGREMITPEETWLKVMGKGETRDYPREASVYALFARQVAERPEAIAIIEGSRRITYAELDEWACGVAGNLQAAGVVPGDVVGTIQDRSMAVIAVWVGILKVGAAYMPLNPKEPAARCAALIREAGARIVIAASAYRDQVPADIACLGIEAMPLKKAEPVENLGGDRLACILFTSGSSGMPKAVEVTHRGISRLVFGQDFADFGPDQTILQLASLSFDLSTFEIWGALLRGGRLVVHPDGPLDLAHVARSIKEEGVSLMWLNGSLFDAIIDEQPLLLDPVKQLVIGGEALSVPHVRRACQLLGQTKIVNGYGPTENATLSTWFPIPREIPADWPSIPIGRPLVNSSAYVLDEHLRLVPVGTVGEIWVGGDGVALGYRNQPELTAERFVADLFSDEPGARLYRTGDLGLVLPDGNLQYHGRADDQMKIRGFRIEPGEIEAVALQVPGVHGFAVLAVDDGVAGKRLVACVLGDRSEATRDLLRERFRAGLPDHMQPTFILALEAWPLTSHDKCDRRALAAMALKAMKEDAAGLEAPMTPRQAEIQAIFQDLLGRERIGLQDDFFALGGHSLLIVRLAARISHLVGEAIDLNRIAKNPSIQGVCAILEQGHSPASDSGPWKYLIPVRAEGQGRPVFFVPGAGGDEGALAFYSRLANFVPGRPFIGFRAVSSQRKARLLEPDVAALARAFVGEMLIYQADGPYDIAGGCNGGVVAFEIACELARRGKTVNRVVMLDTICPSPMNVFHYRVRAACVRIRRQAAGLLRVEQAPDDTWRKRVYGWISRCLPVPELNAHHGVSRAALTFDAATMSHRPSVLEGSLRMVVSQEFSEERSDLPWREFASRDVKVRIVPGDHYSYIREHLATTGQAFRDALESAD